MTTNEIAVPAAAAQPDRVGQATAVEQSRAVAEVQGAILVAQRCPRNVNAAVAEMESSCEQKGLADRAFYSVPRAGGAVNGATVHLARELARVWGNLQYGVSEMRRDDVFGQSEMKAFAWDVQTNTRVETTFVVPHIRDRSAKLGGPLKLTSMDDIYMSNANAGARRVRECIFSILPPWFVEQAKENCQKTLEHGGGIPLPKRIATIIKAFDELDVTVDQLERRIGRPNAKWTARDVGQLTIIGGSLKRGEVRKEDEFPPERVQVADLGDAPEPAAATKVNGHRPAETADDIPADIPAPTKAQMARMHAALNDCGVEETSRHATLSQLAGRAIASASDLSLGDVLGIIEVLGRCTRTDNPVAALDAVLASLEQEVRNG